MFSSSERQSATIELQFTGQPQIVLKEIELLFIKALQSNRMEDGSWIAGEYISAFRAEGDSIEIVSNSNRGDIDYEYYVMCTKINWSVEYRHIDRRVKDEIKVDYLKGKIISKDDDFWSDIGEKHNRLLQRSDYTSIDLNTNSLMIQINELKFTISIFHRISTIGMQIFRHYIKKKPFPEELEKLLQSLRYSHPEMVEPVSKFVGNLCDTFLLNMNVFLSILLEKPEDENSGTFAPLNHEAIEKIEQVVKNDPNNDDSWTNWALVLLKTGKYSQAIEKCARAIEINPKNEKAWTNWGESLNRWTYYYEQMNNLERDALENAEQAYYIVGAEKYAEAVKINPLNDMALANWGKFLTKLKKYAEGAEKCAKAVEINPQNDTAWANYGPALSGLKNNAAACFTCETAVEINPQNDAAWANWGFALMNLKRFAEATEKCAKAVEINPFQNDAWMLWKGNLYFWEKYQGLLMNDSDKLNYAIALKNYEKALSRRK